MNLTCNKCQTNNLFVEIEGNRRGLYCKECGKWQKWITKEELRVANVEGLQVIDKNKIINEGIDSQTKILELEAISGLHIEQIIQMFKEGYSLRR